VIVGSYIKEKEAVIIKHLIKHPEQIGPRGKNLAYEIIEYLIAKYAGIINPSEQFAELASSLEHDGFKLSQNGLRRTLSEEVPIPQEEDELLTLLDSFGYSVAKGHYEQAISAHSRGDWAAANAQLRNFVEEFFDRAAETIVPGTYSSSHERRSALAKAGFFRSELNEWSDNGTGFIQGFWRRLHPQGSHPGLSEKEDSTFRIYLVIVVIHYFAKRLEKFQRHSP